MVCATITMALDQQNNWNVAMSQPFRVKPQSPDFPAASQSSEFTPYELPRTSREVVLPIEIIIQIVSYLPSLKTPQKTLWACCLLSRSWYSAAIPYLYKEPRLTGRNFQLFVATVCPSKNAHIRRSHLAELVEKLDMGGLVHDGSRSLTARLLGRLKGHLLEFVAPQASFSINSFAALSKCTGLTHLNLSLMSSSISIKLLFQTLRSLVRLQTLFFPRTSSHDYGLDLGVDVWPPQLQNLYLAGGIDNEFLLVYVAQVPPSLQMLSIQHCQRIYLSSLQDTLIKIGPQLRYLTLRYPMMQLPLGALDQTLQWCPNLLGARISAEYITNLFFEEPPNILSHPLRVLELECSESAGMEVDLHPDGIWCSIDSGYLPNLRRVGVSARLAWEATESLRNSVSDLVDLMMELEERSPMGIKPGVWQIVS